jgi:alpha-galactosidase
MPVGQPSIDDAPAGDPGLLHLSAGGVSLVLDVRGSRLPAVLHWGAELGTTAPRDLVDLATAATPQPIGFSVDIPVHVSMLPEQSAGWLGTPGLSGHRQGRAWSSAFTVTDWRTERRDDNTDAVVFFACDQIAELEVELEVELHASGVLRSRARLKNTGDDVYWVNGMELFLPVPEYTTELLDFTGHHLRERSPQRTAFTHGLRVRENRTGRTGYDSAYVLCAGVQGFGNRHGKVWAIHTAFSGGSRTLAERTFHGRSSLGGGELLLPGEIGLGRGESYATPWLYASYGDGLDELSGRFHRYLRARAEHPRSIRPVVINTWEAVYFDHDLDRLTRLAQAAASVGAERFVLDDGWFGSRRNDTCGLGDWTVSAEVWPHGLKPLIEVVNRLGMEFGLWVEPEMINPDSNLARAHPDWIMAAGERVSPTARSQQVLDLANPQAYRYLLERLDALLSENAIRYLKWDHNRDLVDAGHPATGRAGVHNQTLAVYRLLDELRIRHPGLEIESCSSGGGRVDLEVLARTDRVWASDCIDAHERVVIQRWTSLLIPLELIGSHIGAPRSHTTKRDLPLDMRAGTAIFGHLGIEWDLTQASEGELDRLRQWVNLYKQVRGLLHTGVLVHGELSNPAYELTGVVAQDGTEALYAVTATATSVSYPPGSVALPGLDPARTYRVRPQPPGDITDGNAADWGAALPWWSPTGVRLSGRALDTAGLQLPVLYPDRVVLIRVTEAADPK